MLMIEEEKLITEITELRFYAVQKVYQNSSVTTAQKRPRSRNRKVRGLVLNFSYLRSSEQLHN